MGNYKLIFQYSIYNKVNRLNCDLSRKLKQWWRKLNNTQLKRYPIDIKNTSYYSCRHTFATLYLRDPNANISELATLMGRNSEYIDTYIREIESDKTISKASDKVFGRKKRQQEDYERKQILKNQKAIMEMQKQILDRLGTKELLMLHVPNRVIILAHNKKIKVEKHLSLSVWDLNILYINVL